jgi:predicted nucleic-acid-binding Zn-ribbon protein
MRDGTCSRCGASTVYAAANGVSLGGSDRAGLRPNLDPGFRGAIRLQQTDLWTFACTTCGALELYLLDVAAHQYIAANWSPVQPAV